MSKTDPLEALSNIKPQTKAAQVRQLFPVIEEKIAAGVRIADITKALNDSGIEISEGTLKTYLHRFRKKQTSAPRQTASAQAAPDMHTKSSEPKPAQESPHSPISPENLESLMKPDPQTQAADLARYERLAKQQRRSRKK